MKRKFLTLLLVIGAIIFSSTASVGEDNNAIKVVIDKTELEFDVSPIISNGRTLVPMRAIFEYLGADVDWDDETRTASAKKDDISIKIKIGDTDMYVNEDIKELDVPAVIQDGRTLVPLRAISESFGYDVGWYGTQKTVYILSDIINYTMVYKDDNSAICIKRVLLNTYTSAGWHINNDIEERYKNMKESTNNTSVTNGIICFTFDDAHCDNWIKAMELFEKYNATATFFFSGYPDKTMVDAAKTLYDAGHSIGLHTIRHADAPDYFASKGGEAYYEYEIKESLEAFSNGGITVKSFAYPNNKRTEETDSFLGQYFEYFRTGISNATEEEKFVPLDKLSDNKVMHGFGIGEYYKTVEEELLDKIRYAAQNNVCVTFFSHDIYSNAPHIHMPAELLEKCLQTAQEEGVKVIGFDDLDGI